MASVIEQLNTSFYLNSHVWLAATILDRTVLEFSSTPLPVLVLHGWLECGPHKGSREA